MKMMKPMNMGRVCTASVTKSIGGIYTIRKSSPSPESCLKQTNKQTNKNNNQKKKNLFVEKKMILLLLSIRSECDGHHGPFNKRREDQERSHPFIAKQIQTIAYFFSI